PLLDHLCREESAHTRAMILAPTRELAEQIDQNIEALGYYAGVSSMAVIGGKNPKNWDSQKFAMVNGSVILVATPGRLISHMALGFLNTEHIQMVILDEADKMLDMGFYGDIVKIISKIEHEHQTLMFSATMPKKIRQLAKAIMREKPVEINLNLSKPAEGINQMAFPVYDEQKIPLLGHLLQSREVDSMIIFASSKASVDRIERTLRKLDFPIRAIHSDRSQEERQETLRAFKNKQFKILVGTDVLARGIDIDNLSHVLNFDVPLDAEDYVHRVGRTARASSTGEAMTFISPKDMHRFRKIEQLIESEVPKPEIPEELGETPEYRKSSGGRGDRGRGRGRGGDRRHRGGGGRGGYQNRRNRQGGSQGGNAQQGGNGQKSNGQSGNGPQSESGEGAPKKKRRNRNRNRNRNRRRNQNPGNGGGDGANKPSTPSAEG
ncbi:MAG: DEAD/DEAH box helicase, partial [Bacteroidota bacterium]